MRKGQHKKNLTDGECNNLVQHLLTRCTSSGKLPKGVAEDMGKLFDCTPTTVRRIWRRASVDLSGSKTICATVHQRKKGQSGRKRMYTDIPERIQAIPQSRRNCFRSIAYALNIPKSTLHVYFKRGVIAKYSSVLKPSLTESNKVCRLNWAIKHVTDIDRAKYFDPMNDTVHVDEKWFFITRLQKKIYGAPGEKIKQRSCKSKRHLLKVIFLSAVARPRWDQAKGEWFDGKIGTWHFTEVVPAQRRSCRRDAGTPAMKTVTVTRDTYKAMIIDNVIPAIRSKWPSDETKRVKIQQDNARPHVPPSDAAIVAACKAMGWDMEVVFQPPNSPDLNVLDLGFFRAIQTLQVEKHSSSIEDIVAATDAAWAAVSTTTLNKNFLTLQRCLQEVILDTGGNDYKIPHMKKDVLLARGRLPEMVSCERNAWRVGCAYLSRVDYAAHMEKLDREVQESMEMGVICTQIEALTIYNDTEVHDDIVAALGLVQLSE
ncbi:hypothetical protein DYB30_002754 [Aphanomyces astaci]|uniref:Tc1-like transposase DDE domain-containing protein n=1 Tax=Aphanomyces astaci TaxID=112090 RepID=A0A397CBJ2_APHAT|nr:hypothetical protein DYB30_002754 [Aphanomyces astaci]